MQIKVKRNEGPSQTQTEIVLVAYLRPMEILKIIQICQHETSFPIRLYLDGPRSEAEDSIQRKLIEQVEQVFPQVRISRSLENHGCRYGVLRALEASCRESQAKYFIVLEDDCVPDPSFFRFVDSHCSELDDQLLSICGKSPISISSSVEKLTSDYVLIHGWAMSRLNLALMLKEAGSPRSANFKKRIPRTARIFWELCRLKVELGYLDTWDAHWMIASWTMPGRNLIPALPMIENVGTISTREPPRSMASRSKKSLRSTRLAAATKEQHDQTLLQNFFGISASRAIRWTIQIYLLKLVLLIRRYAIRLRGLG